jgi:hypothetical protein
MRYLFNSDIFRNMSAKRASIAPLATSTRSSTILFHVSAHQVVQFATVTSLSLSNSFAQWTNIN